MEVPKQQQQQQQNYEINYWRTQMKACQRKKLKCLEAKKKDKAE